MSDEQRIPPQALDAEESVLGAILLNSKVVLENVRDVVAPADFYRESHATIFRAALEMDGRGEPVDVITLERELEATGRLKDVPDGADRLLELAALVPATANASHYARIVADKARQRQRLRILGPIVDADWNGGASADEVRAALEAVERIGDASLPALRTRGVDLSRVRPVRWAWHRRLPLGSLALIVGNEACGKGTLTSWIAARATCGELEGDLHGMPANVLIVGDEDGFDAVWVPRLWTAGADLTRLRTLDDGEYLDELATTAQRLARTVEQENVSLVVFDQLLDHIPGGTSGEAINNPKAVRQALTPLRRVAADRQVAVLGLLHPTKGSPRSFRDLVAGSHQFNAVSRSSLLLAQDPEGDDSRRVLVRGKGNYSAAPRSLEFAIVGEAVTFNDETFDVSKVIDVAEGDRTIDDLLKPAAAPVRDELADRIGDLLTDGLQSRADLARAVDRDPKDGSVANALNWLEKHGIAERTPKGWKRA